MRVGAPSLAALQVTDALGAQAGPLGQFLLRQSGGFPQMPQPLAERGILTPGPRRVSVLRHEPTCLSQV